MNGSNARNAREQDRRRFLKEGAALAALARGGIRSASAQTPGSGSSSGSPPDRRAYGERSRFETAVRAPLRTGPGFLSGRYPAMSTPLQDSLGIITPSALHAALNHGYNPPDIDPREHRLLIHGLVDRPLIFTMDELKRLPSVSRIHFVECQGNSSPGFAGGTPENVQDAHGRTSCSEWTGVLVSVLLREAGVRPGARWVDAEGADEAKPIHTMPLEKALDDAMVAYGQNGEAVRPEQGYPLRLLLPGFEGSRNIKWLRRLKVVEEPQMSLWTTVMYTSLRRDGKTRWFNFEVGPKSVITFPSGQQRLPGRGFYEITGLAWSGGGTVRRVEVSTDGGRSWKDAQLQEPILRHAHTRFRFPWNWNGEEAVLRSRCTDERGNVQPTLAEYSRIVGVGLEELRAGWGHHFNPIFSWRVTREGKVQNAIWES